MVKFNDLDYTDKFDKEARFDILAEEIDAAVAGDSTISARVDELSGVVGDEDSGLVKDVNDLDSGKADANHSHTISNISDADTATIEITYTDDSTETKTFVIQDSN